MENVLKKPIITKVSAKMDSSTTIMTVIVINAMQIASPVLVETIVNIVRTDMY